MQVSGRGGGGGGPLIQVDGQPGDEDQEHHAPHHAPDDRVYQGGLSGGRRGYTEVF
ncbi:hypothetical protein E2C01_102253 [Portunus trituberculatus]|uniref:Uncharacterized protein n=1 Tax=Portunus trituberculatus TaxID=210409 RepID=A0A5B7KGU9_PORTR|nr:hypothetical protein [Portunus trituberculatus]